MNQENRTAFEGLDYYEFLGVSRDATLQTITAAFRQRALALHPDTGDSDGAEMRLLNSIYRELRDPELRAVYDRSLQLRSIRERPKTVNLQEFCSVRLNAGSTGNSPSNIFSFDGWIPAGNGPWQLQAIFTVPVSITEISLEAGQVPFPVRRQNWDLVEVILISGLDETVSVFQHEFRQLYRGDRDIHFHITDRDKPVSSLLFEFSGLPLPSCWRNCRIYGKSAFKG